jgi:predicted MFS family arabinose efflux permease
MGQFFQSASDAYVSDITPTQLRPDAYSRIRVGLNLGWMIGPAIGAFLARTPFSLIFAFTGVLCLGGAAIAFLFCSETLPPDRHTVRPPPLSRWSLPGRRELVWHLSCAFMLFLVTSQLVSTLSVYAVGLPGIDKNGVGFLYTVNGLVVILVQIPLNRFLGGGRLSIRLAAGALLYSLGYFSMGYGTAWIHLMLSVVVLTLGETLTEPALAAGVSRLSTPERMGRAMGLYGLVRGMGYSLGPYLGALLYERLATQPVLLWGLLAASAVPAAVGFLLMRRVEGLK